MIKIASGIMIKEATRLRKMVRKLPLDDLAAFVRRNTSYTDDIRNVGELSVSDKMLGLSAKYPREIALEVLSDPKFARAAAKNKTLSFRRGVDDGVMRTYKSDMWLQDARLQRPSLVGAEVLGHEAAFEKRRMNPQMLKWLENRGTSLDIMTPHLGASIVRRAKEKLPNKLVLPIKDAPAVDLPYSPSEFVYRGSSTAKDKVIKGPRFVTPHPKIAGGYGKKDPNAVVRQMLVDKLKFRAANKKGVPVYTPHIGETSAEGILKHVGSSKREIGQSDWGDLTDYEGVVERIISPKLYKQLANGKFRRASRQLTPQSVHEAKARQAKEWVAE